MQTPLGMDFSASCPTSAGISDASTLPVQRPGTNPPGIPQPSSSPSIYACPAVGTPGYPHPGPPQTSGTEGGGRSSGGKTHDEVRKDRSPIPKLNVKGGDATALTRQVNEWLQKTTISLNTWSQSAATFWAQGGRNGASATQLVAVAIPCTTCYPYRLTNGRSTHSFAVAYPRGNYESRTF